MCSSTGIKPSYPIPPPSITLSGKEKRRCKSFILYEYILQHFLKEKETAMSLGGFTGNDTFDVFIRPPKKRL
jgi:hypothetical protein